jgi:hypothetical protein
MNKNFAKATLVAALAAEACAPAMATAPIASPVAAKAEQPKAPAAEQPQQPVAAPQTAEAECVPVQVKSCKEIPEIKSKLENAATKTFEIGGVKKEIKGELIGLGECTATTDPVDGKIEKASYTVTTEYDTTADPAVARSRERVTVKGTYTSDAFANACTPLTFKEMDIASKTVTLPPLSARDLTRRDTPAKK